MSKKTYRKDKTCLNCKHVVENKFCPNCGQKNTDTHKTFINFLERNFCLDVLLLFSCTSSILWRNSMDVFFKKHIIIFYKHVFYFGHVNDVFYLHRNKYSLNGTKISFKNFIDK